MPDYIPGSDDSFYTWEQQFTAYVGVRGVAMGLTEADVTALAEAQEPWQTKHFEHVAKVNAARASTATKDQARDTYEAMIRSLVRRLQVSPTVTDADRRDMGIPIKDEQPTPVGPVATQPSAAVKLAGTLQHEVRFVDAATSTKRAKPAGVVGCEVWVKIGEPPVSESEFRFLGLTTASPYLAEYTLADAGKTAHYRLRWVSSGGTCSPWSDIESATIAA